MAMGRMKYWYESRLSRVVNGSNGRGWPDMRNGASRKVKGCRVSKSDC